ncbi:hypothetical protein GCM10009544_03820 [Streptomyces stramineus]|uniref:Transposase n=1 Tax=Streptomyces stramineus TaxID=173861 RepID=A0ABP3JAM6_9ACTN
MTSLRTNFPPYKTVYDYYAKWEADGTTEQVHDLLRDKARRAHGRSPEPTAAVVDAQSVKTSASDRADLRLADAAPPPGPGLRSTAPEIPGNDPLGDG